MVFTMQSNTKHLIEEFSTLSNAEAYVHIFQHRMMKPVFGTIAQYYGCDHRIDMAPKLNELVARFPMNGSLLDVGAGAGDVLDFALKDLPKGSLINLVEPNSTLLARYVSKLAALPHLRLGITYPGILQDYYDENGPAKAQDLILAIHMIYHLTDFTQPHITPEKDLEQALAFLYDQLTPGGSIFLAYADLMDHPDGEALCGIGPKYFKALDPTSHLSENLNRIYKARNALLGPDGSIAQLLKKRFPETSPLLVSERRAAHFYGEGVEDLAILALAAELCSSDSDPFDMRKLEFSLDYIFSHKEALGITIEDRNIPQKGLWRGNEPHIIATITKQIESDFQ